MSLSLKNKTCKLGPDLNTKNKAKGDESKPTKHGKFIGILLTPAEFNKLKDDKHAHDCWYDTGAKPAEPLDWVKNSGSIPHGKKYKECEITIEFGISKETITVQEARINNIKHEPTVGGKTAMTCNWHGVIEASKKAAELEEFLKKEVTVSIKFGEIDAGDDGDDPQGKLDIDHDKVEDEDSDEEKEAA